MFKKVIEFYIWTTGKMPKMVQMDFKLLSKNDHMKNDSLIILPQT